MYFCVALAEKEMFTSIYKYIYIVYRLLCTGEAKNLYLMSLGWITVYNIAWLHMFCFGIFFILNIIFRMHLEELFTFIWVLNIKTLRCSAASPLFSFPSPKLKTDLSQMSVTWSPLSFGQTWSSDLDSIREGGCSIFSWGAMLLPPPSPNTTKLGLVVY